MCAPFFWVEFQFYHILIGDDVCDSGGHRAHQKLKIKVLEI